MNRIDFVTARYVGAAYAAVGLGETSRGVELAVVADSAGRLVDKALRGIIRMTRDDQGGRLEEILPPARAFRYRLLTHIQPLEYQSSLRDLADFIVAEATPLSLAVGPEAAELLRALSAAVNLVAASDPVVGQILLDSITEFGNPHGCVVVAANGPAAAGIGEWLGALGVRVVQPGELMRTEVLIEQAYFAGPPWYFPLAVASAPVSEAQSYFMPDWFTDRNFGPSPFAEHGENVVRVVGRIFPVGDDSQVESEGADVAEVNEQDLEPQPVWKGAKEPDRPPSPDEVLARRVLLGGGYAILLDDDGDRIRAVDITKPDAVTITFVALDSIVPGTCLLLRDGESEPEVTYKAALELLGEGAEEVVASQQRWKTELESRLDHFGPAKVVADLANKGVKTLDRVTAWTDETLTRPQSEFDFLELLKYLGVPVQETYDRAEILRKARIAARNEFADKLEQAVAEAEIADLERNGFVRLQAQSEGFSDVIATKVLAISPVNEIVPRHDVRVIFSEPGALWLK